MPRPVRSHLVLRVPRHLRADLLLPDRPILVIMPLSFNAEDFFTFTPGMLALRSGRLFAEALPGFLHQSRLAAGAVELGDDRAGGDAAVDGLGTLAAIGLSRRATCRSRAAIMAILISPMIVPLIISAAGMYFFYSPHRAAGHLLGVVLAHAALGTPSSSSP
jgi:putative spermidine/putrescine transport system permease protein